MTAVDPELELFARTLDQAAARYQGPSLDSALAEVGWLDALEADTRTAVSLFFPIAGRGNAASSALQHVVGAALGLDPGAATGLVLPSWSSAAPPGDLRDGALSVRGLVAAAVAASSVLTVVVSDGSSVGLVPVSPDGLVVRPFEGLDPELGLVEVTGSAEAGPLAPVDWSKAVQWAQIALSYQLVGTARAMLELARRHALEREQFGHPIARFQAVRHRLAEAYVAIESADALLEPAWDEPELLAPMAKALAGRAARTTARHCQQVLAGMGFTAEHPFHRYFRRALSLDHLFGSSRSLTEALGRSLLETRRLPAALIL